MTRMPYYNVVQMNDFLKPLTSGKSALGNSAPRLDAPRPALRAPLDFVRTGFSGPRSRRLGRPAPSKEADARRPGVLLASPRLHRPVARRHGLVEKPRRSASATTRGCSSTSSSRSSWRPSPAPREFELPYAALLVSALLAAAYATATSSSCSKGRSTPPTGRAGLMGHYMTQGGVFLLFCALALAFVFFKRGKVRGRLGGRVRARRRRPPPDPDAQRLDRHRRGALRPARPLEAEAHPARPGPGRSGLFRQPRIRSRSAIQSIFSLQGYSNAERVEYAKAGLKIVKDYPLFGTGPKTVSIVFQDPKYGLSELARRNVHLHSNLFQIAAERGPRRPAGLAGVRRLGVRFAPPAV